VRDAPAATMMAIMENSVPTVVIIDDSAEVRALIRTQIRLSGLLTVVADGADGTEAIGLAYRHRPDLVLLDMSMPTMDGMDAISGVLAVSPTTKVVIFTGFEGQGLAERARDLGASMFIEKSMPVERLPRELLRALDPDGDTPPPPAKLSVVASQEAAANASDQRVLDEHLERFREVFDEAAIGMATMTLTGGIVRANRALGEILLRKQDELVGADYGVLTAGRGDLLDVALEDINQRGADLIHIEHEVVGGTEPRQILATLAPVRDARRQALYIFLQVQDITAQRAAEDKLRWSEERFRLLVDTVEDYAIFMLSPEGIISSWNAGAQRTKGYTADEIIGRHFRTFYPQEQRDARHPEYELERALADGHYSEEGWRIRKDGSRFWANVLITAVFDEAGEHIGFAKVTRDVTANREAQETLRQSEERFRLLVEAVGDYAIFMLDPDGHVVSWNTGAQRSKGYISREIIGQHFRIFYPPELQESKHPEYELATALESGRYEEEGWRVRKDGTRFWANVVITAVFNDLGDHVGFAKVTRDRTDGRRAEVARAEAAEALAIANEALEGANAQLTQAAADQSQFLAVTAHELRTPAAVLGGSADTLTRHWDELTDDERLGLLQGMSTSADRLRRLLSDLLTASRLDAEALGLRRRATPVGEVVSGAITAAISARPGLTIHADEVAEADVLIDPDRAAQAIDNLIANSVVHGAPPITLGVTITGQMAEIRVRDAGEGVGRDMQSRLFDRFATGDSVGGTGLGLFIARELARANGGDAFYEPGTADAPSGAFVIALPLA
jgi:PAS domain S-box-containing protein